MPRDSRSAAVLACSAWRRPLGCVFVCVGDVFGLCRCCSVCCQRGVDERQARAARWPSECDQPGMLGHTPHCCHFARNRCATIVVWRSVVQCPRWAEGTRTLDPRHAVTQQCGFACGPLRGRLLRGPTGYTCTCICMHAYCVSVSVSARGCVCVCVCVCERMPPCRSASSRRAR